MANNLNQNALMSMLKYGGNPRDIAIQIINQQYPNDPFAHNLLQMAERGDTQNLQQVVGRMLGAQGRNLSAEMQNLFGTLRNFQ